MFRYNFKIFIILLSNIKMSGSLIFSYEDKQELELASWTVNIVNTLRNKNFSPINRKEDIYDKIGYYIVEIFGGIPDFRNTPGLPIAVHENENISSILNERGYIYYHPK